MAKALYPGTFDPITLGHMDVVETASKMFEEVIIAVMVNPAKTPMITLKQRVIMIEKAIKECGLTNVRVTSSEGLTVEVAKREKAQFILRGLRLTTDYEQELFLLLNNQVLAPEINTVLIPPKQEHLHISSTAVRTLLEQESFETLKSYLPEIVYAHVTFGR